MVMDLGMLKELGIDGYYYRLFGVIFIKEDNGCLAASSHLTRRQIAGNGNIFKVDLIAAGKLDSSRIVTGVETL